MWLRAFGVWLLLMVAEVVHGVLRLLFLVPVVGDFRARQIGVLSGSLIVLAIACLRIAWMDAGASNRRLGAIGLAWVSLTLVFEFGLGRFVFGYSWDRILSDYNLARGGLLPLGLLVMMAAPLLAARLRG